MGIAASRFRVMATAGSPSIWPPTSSHNVKLYTFFDDYNAVPLTIPVTIISKTNVMMADMLHVRVAGTWKPLKEWISGLINKQIFSGDLGYEAQQKWWTVNHKCFRMMDLPAELRLIIYEHALGPNVFPLSTVSRKGIDKLHARQSARVVLGLGYGPQVLCSLYTAHLFSGRRMEEYPPWTPHPNLALLQLNKTIHSEAVAVGWEATRKCFVDIRILTTVLDARNGPAGRYQWLKKVQLHLTNEDYFRFFGVNALPVLHYTSSKQQGHCIRDLPGLLDLQMSFRSPYDGWDGSPWGQNLYKHHTATAIGECYHEACQRTVVNWIMTFAFPYIKHIPKVRLVGAVKRDTREKWEYILAQEYAKEPHGYCHETAFKAILKTPDYFLPPLCTCRVRCAVCKPNLNIAMSGLWRGSSASRHREFDTE